MVKGDTIGRDENSTDTNQSDDWCNDGGRDAIGPTPEKIRIHWLSQSFLLYELRILKTTFSCSGIVPCSPAVVFMVYRFSSNSTLIVCMDVILLNSYSDKALTFTSDI